MMTVQETRFEEIKSEILRRAREAQACTEQYGRAYKSETLAELMQVIKDNFHWACDKEVVTPDIIERYREEFASNDIYLNKSIEHGFLLCDNATVRASGNATVEAWDNATVEAWDNATVEAWGNAYCTSYFMIECKLSERAIYRVRYDNTVYYADETITFKKQETTDKEA